MSGPVIQPDIEQQTTFGACHKLQVGDRMKSININVAADKFLLGTMDALAYKQATPPMTAIQGEPVSFRPETGLTDTENTVGYSNIGPGDTGSSGFNHGCEESCSPQKKSKPNPRPSRPPLLPPCRVCNDRASGYHYGVNTCEACKGFFRRSICKTEPYVCTGTGDCKTVAGKRTACSYCRFKRCIAVGMSKNAIKTGRYTHELRSKNILEVKRLQKQASDESPERASVESLNNDKSYMEYKTDLLRNSVLEDTLELLVNGQKMLYEYLDDYYNDDLIRERQFSVYTRYLERKRKLLLQSESLTRESGRPSTDKQQLSSLTEQKLPQNDLNTSKIRHLNSQVSQSLPKVEGDQLSPLSGCIVNTDRRDCELSSDGLNELTAQDKMVEIDVTNDVGKMHLQSDENIAETGSDKPRIKSENCVLPQTESLRAEVMAKIIKDLEQGVQGMLAFSKSLPGFTDLPSQDQVSLVKAARFDIWYLGHIRCFNAELRVGACEWQFHAEELAQVWGNSMVDLAFTLSRVAQTLDLTKDETAALRAVCLTFPDRCMDLQNRHEVEQMHSHMLDVFKFVSCKKHNDFNKWLPKVINFLVLLREFGVKFEAVSSKLTLDWAVLKDNPVLLSVFLS